MTSQDTEYLKAVIKSIVLSCPNQMTIEKLCRDFEEMEGQELPYREHGFTDIRNFLRSLGDAIQIQGYGRRECVKIVSSEKSAHIKKMVREQKKPAKSNKKRGSNKNHCFMTQTMSYYNQISYNSGNDRQRHFVNIARSRQRMGSLKQEPISFIRSWITQPPERLKLKLSDHIEKIEEVEKEFNSQPIPIAIKESTQQINSELNSSQKAFISDQIKIPVDVDYKGIVDNDDRVPLLYNVQSSSSESDSFIESYNPFYSPKEIDDTDEAVPAFAATKQVLYLGFPENAIKIDEKLERAQIPVSDYKTSSIKIYVTEIHNPYKFWFQLHQNADEYSTLIRKMQHRYINSHLWKSNISTTCIIPGQYCAAPYSGVWHRAKIISNIIMGTKAKVFFIDYGTVDYVSIDDIKVLYKEFAKLPNQAIRGSLAQIKPKEMHWTVDPTKCFLNAVFNRAVTARISEYDESNCVAYLIISTDDGIEVNFDLVERGYAMYDVQWAPLCVKKQGGRLRHIRELYPTFDMLENGAYPTLQEILEILSNNHIDYETIIDQTYCRPLLWNVKNHVPAVIHNLRFVLLPKNPFYDDIINEIIPNTDGG